eukprot:508039-Pelagomonas_calceolata.AAC.4
MRFGDARLIRTCKDAPAVTTMRIRKSWGNDSSLRCFTVLQASLQATRLRRQKLNSEPGHKRGGQAAVDRKDARSSTGNGKNKEKRPAGFSAAVNAQHLNPLPRRRKEQICGALAQTHSFPSSFRNPAIRGSPQPEQDGACLPQSLGGISD